MFVVGGQKFFVLRLSFTKLVMSAACLLLPHWSWLWMATHTASDMLHRSLIWNRALWDLDGIMRKPPFPSLLLHCGASLQLECCICNPVFISWLLLCCWQQRLNLSFIFIYRWMPVFWRVYERPCSQASLHSQWMGTESGVSKLNLTQPHFILLYLKHDGQSRMKNLNINVGIASNATKMH